MIYLLLSFSINVGIFALFHLFPKYRIDNLQAIVINYIVCVFTGLIFIGGVETETVLNYQPWLPIAFFLGIIFIGTFYLTAVTTQRYGISVSAIASKMSLAIPVVFALFIFNIESKEFNAWNYLGLVLALASIYLISFKTGRTNNTGSGIAWIILPLLVFIFAGAIDTTINYANYRYLDDSDAGTFPIYVFASASFVGIITLLIRGKGIQIRSIIGGSTLGIINYFSIYFLLLALSSFQNDGALFFPIFNMMIILGSALLSVVLFSEKLEVHNKAGLALSFVALFLISHQEILNYLNR